MVWGVVRGDMKEKEKKYEEFKNYQPGLSSWSQTNEKSLCKAFLETMVLKESLAIIFGKHITEYMT